MPGVTNLYLIEPGSGPIKDSQFAADDASETHDVAVLCVFKCRAADDRQFAIRIAIRPRSAPAEPFLGIP